MRRLTLGLVLLALLAAGVPAALGQSCATPAPTYTPTPGYRATIQAASPGDLLVYYPLNETSGTVAEDDSGNNADGTYSGVTLNTTTFLTGDPAPSFDGINDIVNAYTAHLASTFNGLEGTALAWIQVNAGYWTDNTQRNVINLQVDANNRSTIRKQTSNAIQLFHVAGATTESVTNSPTSTVWLMLAITWSKSGDSFRAYVAGVSVGNTTGLGAFTGSLLSTSTVIGAASTAGAGPHVGNIAQVAVWDVALNPTQVAILATVDPVLTIPPTATLCPTYTPTFTPSWTPTFTPTPTNTPNIRTYLTVVPPGSSAPGQDVLILHQITVGQIMISSLLFVVIVMYLMMFARRMRRG